MMLRIVVVILAIADGLLHLALDFVLFRGNVFGRLPFSSPFPLPLNQLFFLNLIGFVVLAAAFWFAPRFLGPRRWLVDVVLIVYAMLSILGWVQIGKPNPQGLGYLSKALEVGLIVALAVHAWRILRPRRPGETVERAA
jgi:hypothetical protein